MRKTLKYRLYRSERNKHLVGQIELGADIWNHFVEVTRRFYDIYGEYPGYSKLQDHLTKLKKTSHEHWYHLGSQACQDVIRRLDQSYKQFFSGEQEGRPRFKKRRKYSSFTLTQSGWKLPEGRSSNRLRINGKNYKFSLSRPVKGRIKTVTIKRDPVGDLWVCFSVIQDQPQPELPKTGQPVGIDFGLKTFLVTSDGDRHEAPEHFKTSLKEMAKRQRALSRKKKGSGNWHDAKKRVAKLYRRIANQRRDWHFKLARELLSKYDTVCIEDLNLAGMKRLWGRKVTDLGYAQFVEILRHTARKEGKAVRQVGRYFASSKTCSGCGEKNYRLDLKDRDWVCTGCGQMHDRDQNAAINILERAFSSTVDDVRGPHVRVRSDAPVVA